jgi:hypothetical protein
MGRIVVTEFISLDGIIEAPGGGEDWKRLQLSSSTVVGDGVAVQVYTRT